MKKLIGIVASVGLAGAFLVPAASASAASSDKVLGYTAVRVNHEVTNALLQANVTVTGMDPGGSTILRPGKVALEFPVSAIKNGKLEHDGELFLSHTGAMGWRTVVVSNLTIDPNKGTLKGRVYATDTDLGTATIFTLKKQKSGSYTVKLASGVAGILNSALGTHVFVDGMRIGSGVVTLTPQ
ncbi:MAG: hypothetical protein RL134_311 [Actinomycetota bacterium]|jgi:hypothetical protein